MKKLIFWILKRYSNTEEQRWEIYKILYQKTNDNYTEQNRIGNLYNAYIEFMMSNDMVKNIVKRDKKEEIENLNMGFQETFKDSIEYIKKENL